MLDVAVFIFEHGMAPLIAYIYFYPISLTSSMIFNKLVQEELIMTCRSMVE